MECPQLNINELSAEDLEIKSDSIFNKNFARNAGVPERFLDANFDNTSNRCSEAVKSFSELSRGILIIFGTNGTGKSRTACAGINNRIAKKLSPGRYISCNYEVCPLIRASRSFRADRNEYDTLKDFYTTPFLVLDEVGKGDDAVISKMFVTCVLAARYDNNLPTLITTNMNKEELSQFVGADISSRFKETAKVFVLDGADLRGGNNA